MTRPVRPRGQAASPRRRRVEVRPDERWGEAGEAGQLPILGPHLVLRRVKACARCGRRFEKPPDYSLRRWEARRFCSRACHGVEVRPGDVFGRLVVVEFADWASNGKHTRWRCRCDCGTETVVAARGLVQGTTVSCGCWRRENGARMMRRLHASRRRGSKSSTSGSQWVEQAYPINAPTPRHNSANPTESVTTRAPLAPRVTPRHDADQEVTPA